MAEEKQLNIYQKIHAVMKDVEYLKKDDNVQYNKTKYKAISEEKVTIAVRNSLVKNRLIILPVKQVHKREGTLSTVDVTYKIVDIDNGESLEVVSSGTGADTQDKGVGKAMTYAYKYMMLRTFAIPTGEDPDKVSSAELDEKIKQQQVTPEQIGEIKTKALQFAQARNQPPEKVYEALKITKFEELTGRQAIAAIKKLDKWLKAATEKQG